MKFACVAAAAALCLITSAPASADTLAHRAVQALFPGSFHAVVSGGMAVKVTARSDGSLIGVSDKKRDTGNWSVKNGNLCIRFENWTNGRFSCSQVTQDGDWYRASGVKFRKI